MKNSENFELFFDAIAAESEGDYLKCKDENIGFLLGNKTRKEAIVKYSEALNLYDSLKISNEQIAMRISRVQKELNNQVNQLQDEVFGRGVSGQIGYGKVAKTLSQQIDEYSNDLDELMESYGNSLIFYSESELRIRKKIAELE